MRGSGHFQWSAGAWFGSLLGSTLWMLLGSALLFATSSLRGLGPLACFAVANAMGFALWRSRTRLAPYPAFQILLTALGLCALGSLFFLLEGVSGGGRYYRGLLVIPGVMAYLHHLENKARRSSACPE